MYHQLIRAGHLSQIFLVFASVSTAWGGPIFRWIDEEGVTNYTDTLSKIPSKYKAELTAGDEISLISNSRSANPPSASVSPESKTERAAASADDEQAAEDSWRARFKQSYRLIAQLERAIDLDRSMISSGTHAQCSRGSYSFRFATWVCTDPWYVEAKQRIQHNEVELKYAREALDNLERLASRRAIPREWRQP